MFTLGWVLYVKFSKFVTKCPEKVFVFFLLPFYTVLCFFCIPQFVFWLLWIQSHNVFFFLFFVLFGHPIILNTFSCSVSLLFLNFHLLLILICFVFHSFSMSISFSFVSLKWSLTLCVYSHLILSSFSNLTLKNSSCFNGVLWRKIENTKGTPNIRSTCPDRRKEGRKEGMQLEHKQLYKNYKNVCYHQGCFYPIFVLLFVNWLYSCYKTPWWWSLEWPKHVGAEQLYWMSIFVCTFVALSYKTSTQSALTK